MVVSFKSLNLLFDGMQLSKLKDGGRASYGLWDGHVLVCAKSLQSCPTLCDPMDCSPPGSSVHGILLQAGVGYHALLQEIFPTQGSNPGLPHCRQILYQLSHKGSPRILEWVAYCLSSRSSDPGVGPGLPALQVDSLSTELSGKPNRYGIPPQPDTF